MRPCILLCGIFLLTYFSAIDLISQEKGIYWRTIESKIAGSNEKIKIETVKGERVLKWNNPQDMFVKIEIVSAKGPINDSGKISITGQKKILSTHGTTLPLKDIVKDLSLSPGYYAVNVVSSVLRKSDWIVFKIK